MTMSLSRRRFVTDASTLGLLTALLPELTAAQAAVPQVSDDDTPHTSSDLWNGFFDSVNPYSPNYGTKAASHDSPDQLPDPAANTQYLHYKTDEKKLRYADNVDKDELLNYDGDVAISIALSQYRPGSGDSNLRASQLRVDTTQVYPLMNVLAPLAWTSIASLTPDKKTGKIPSLDQLGFHTPQATQGSSNILFTKGAGKLAVNISKAAETSLFIKAINVMMNAAKIGLPLVSLPAISIPALNAFSEVLADWEQRTKFLLNSRPTTALATQQAFADNGLLAKHICLLSGDYLMIPQKHVTDLAKELPNLQIDGGYLVYKEADPNLPLQNRAESTLPGITYATMRLNVKPVEGCSAGKSPAVVN
jgi:hypothetical protein